jgi:hypothetical protein
MRDLHVKMKGDFSYFLNPWLRLEIESMGLPIQNHLCAVTS